MRQAPCHSMDRGDSGWHLWLTSVGTLAEKAGDTKSPDQRWKEAPNRITFVLYILNSPASTHASHLLIIQAHTELCYFWTAFLFFIFILCPYIRVHKYLCLCHLYSCPRWQREDTRPPGTRVTGGCETLCRCWEPAPAGTNGASLSHFSSTCF